MRTNGRFKPNPLIPRRARVHWSRALLCALVISSAPGKVHPGQSQSQPQDPNKPLVMPEANRPPDMNDQMRMREHKVKQANFDVINLQRKNKIAAESAMLLTLAIALKAELDSAPNEKPSANELRKAEGIEKLAHNVKETMELTMGPN